MANKFNDGNLTLHLIGDWETTTEIHGRCTLSFWDICPCCLQERRRPSALSVLAPVLLQARSYYIRMFNGLTYLSWNPESLKPAKQAQCFTTDAHFRRSIDLFGSPAALIKSFTIELFPVILFLHFHYLDAYRLFLGYWLIPYITEIPDGLIHFFYVYVQDQGNNLSAFIIMFQQIFLFAKTC